MLNINEKYKLDNSFEIFEKDDKYLYVDYENSNWFRTNKSGYQILSKINGEKEIGEVIKQYADEVGFPYSIIEKRFTPFLDRAIQRKLLLLSSESHANISTEFAEYPNELWIHLTDLCNMYCPFCYSSSRSTGVRKLDIGKIINFVEKIPYEKRKRIIISGGEPFLYTELPELVKELKALCFEITVISNGTAGNDKYAEVLKYIDALQISVDGTKEEIYELTRGKGNFNKAIRSLNYAHELGMNNILVSFTTNKNNINDIENLPGFCLKNHVNHIHITKIIPSGRANDIMDKIVPNADEYRDAIKRLSLSLIETNKYIQALRDTEEFLLSDCDKTKPITLSISTDPVKKLVQQTKITTCSLANGTISIGYDGNVYSCGCLHQPYTQIGTIDDHIDTIMKNGLELCKHYSVDSPEMKDCYKCKYKYICGGGCRSSANGAGDINGADPLCEYYKSRIEEVMWNSPSFDI